VIRVLSCRGVVCATGDRTLERCVDFCRCDPKSREVEETPWAPSWGGILGEAAWRSVEVGLGSCRCRPSTTLVLSCPATRMLGSDRTRLWVFTGVADRGEGEGSWWRSFRRVVMLRSSHRNATVVALLFSCSVTSTRSIVLRFNQASGFGRSRRTHAERYKNHSTGQIRTPETVGSGIVP